MVDIFQDLTTEELKEIERATAMTTCAAGKMFYSPNQYGEVMFILKKGKVQIYRMSSEGRKLVIDTLGPGTIFGEMSLIGTGLYDAFAEAMEDSLICIMNRRNIEKLILKNSRIGIRLLELMGQRLRESDERLEQTLVPRSSQSAGGPAAASAGRECERYHRDDSRRTGGAPRGLPRDGNHRAEQFEAGRTDLDQPETSAAERYPGTSEQSGSVRESDE